MATEGYLVVGKPDLVAVERLLVAQELAPSTIETLEGDLPMLAVEKGRLLSFSVASEC